MEDHPEFPQDYEKTPALKYIVGQVSLIESASNCIAGYYKQQATVLTRLTKVDTELNRLREATTALREIADAEVIAKEISIASEHTQEMMYERLTHLNKLLTEEVGGRMEMIRLDQKGMLGTIDSTNDRSKRIQNDLTEKMGVAIQDLQSLINNVNTRFFPPMWMSGWFWIWTGLAIGAGFYVRGLL